MNWKLVYRALVRVRNWLNTLIGWARAKAYPKKAAEPEAPAEKLL